MKFTKNYIATLLGLFIAATSYGQQDLIQQVPESASFVVVINNQAIIKHSSFEKINEVLGELGAFDEIGNEELQIQSINDLDLSYDRNAYIYKADTDSSYYIGILLPLKAGHQIGTNLFSKLSPLPASQGYERRASTDGKTQVAWNDHSVLILTGDAHRYYFDNDSVAQRYGIESPHYDEPAALFDYQYEAVPDSAYVAYVEDVADSVSFNIPPPAIPESEVYTDYPVYDDYSDSTYLKEIARNAKNDSLRNLAFASWLARDFDGYLYPSQNATSHKFLNKFDKKNTLVHFWARNMMSLYSQSIPYYMPYMRYDLANQMEKLAYAYQDIVLDLVQEKHTLKLRASVGLDKEMDRLVKPIYKNKLNRKFGRYIPENHIGYMSININSEAYLNSFPAMMGTISKMGLYPSDFTEIADILATVLEVSLDEKAIADVMSGEHLVFINELKKVQKEYIDYQYDEHTFDYKEIKKTKDDYIPTFLWMFTSEDQRIYKKILKLGESKEKVTQTDGIYRIADNPSDEIIYTLFKDNIVFVSNDVEQLSAIQTNRFRTARDKQIKKQIYANTMTAVTHLAEIPETINRLGIPVITRWDHLVNNLSGYGDITITAQGNKRGRITGEMAVDFPQEETNALQYLLQELLNNIAK